MADYATCRRDLLLSLRARIPLVCLKTDERARGLALFHEVSRDLDGPIYYYTPSPGARPEGRNVASSPSMNLAETLDRAALEIRRRHNLTYVLTAVQELERDNDLTRRMVDLLASATNQSGAICVISPEPLWDRLRRLGTTLVLDPPNDDEMTTIVEEFVDRYRGTIPVEWGPEETRQAGLIMAGFSKLEAENQLLRLVANGGIRKTDVSAMAQGKDLMLVNTAGLKRVPVSPTDLAVGGLRGLSAWLEKRQPLMRMDLRELGLRPPRGVLLVGAPGCGKSLSARLIAASWGLALYRLDLSSVDGSGAAQVEQCLKAALATAERLAPCVLWIDEIEKELWGGPEGRVTRRLVGDFLLWLREGNARVFVVSTANDIAQLPAELLRRGYFDELFFVDLPGEHERREIIALYTARYLGIPLADDMLARLVSVSAGFAGSDLEAAVAEVARLAVLDGTGADQTQRWLDVFARVTPVARIDPERLERVRAWSRQRTLPASG